MVTRRCVAMPKVALAASWPRNGARPRHPPFSRPACWARVGQAAGDYGNVSFITYASQRFRKASMSFSPRTFWRVLYPVGSSFRAATKSR